MHFPLSHSFLHTNLKSPCGAGAHELCSLIDIGVLSCAVDFCLTGACPHAHACDATCGYCTSGDDTVPAGSGAPQSDFAVTSFSTDHFSPVSHYPSDQLINNDGSISTIQSGCQQPVLTNLHISTGTHSGGGHRRTQKNRSAGGHRRTQINLVDTSCDANDMQHRTHVVRLSVCLSVCLSVSLSVCLSVSLSLCLSVANGFKGLWSLTGR